jgi:hypothetical protein
MMLYRESGQLGQNAKVPVSVFASCCVSATNGFDGM